MTCQMNSHWSGGSDSTVGTYWWMPSSLPISSKFSDVDMLRL